ncbi:MAG: membrane protein insertase YidC [Bacteroidota bacterium]
MDRNSIIGLVLIAGILIGYGVLTRPSAEEIERQKYVADSTASAQARITAEKTKAIDTTAIKTAFVDSTRNDSAVLAAKTAELASKYGAFGTVSTGTEAEKIVETDKFRITFSNKGGRIKDITLKEYNTHAGTPVHLFDPKSAVFGFNFGIAGKGTFNTQKFFFTPVASPDKVSGDQSITIAYRLPAGAPDKYIELLYTIKGNAYDIDLQLNTRNLDGVVDNGKKLALEWKASGLPNEKSLVIERQRSSVYYKPIDDDRDYLSETSESDEEVLEDPVSWVAFKQYFFTAAVISKEGFAAENSVLKVVQPADSAVNKKYSALLTLPQGNVTNGSTNLKLYFGPTDYQTLAALDVDQMDRIIDFGWGIFGLVNKYFIFYIFKALTWFHLGIGITILLLTIVIKMLLMPLTYKNYQSSAKMRILKPEVDAINEKLKNADPMKKQQEMMALYKKTGVNPLAGCLPVLIQMPFLYAMFRFFPAIMDLRQQSFLWADDLSSYDSIASIPNWLFGGSIPIYGDHVSLFTILMCASTFLYTRMNSGNMPAPQQGMPDMKVIMYIFPFMMLFFFNNYASGLAYYYLAANLVTMAQTFIIRKYFVDEKKIMATIEENKKKPGGEKSKLQRKMEEMAGKRNVKLPK